MSGPGCRPMPVIVYAHLAQRCVDVRGRTRMAAALGVDVEDMRRMCRGDVVPTSRQRDLLDVWFASLLGRELVNEGLGVRCQCEGEEKLSEEEKRQ